MHRGDALNVILDELSAPGVYSRSISAAQAPLSTSLVKPCLSGTPHKRSPSVSTSWRTGFRLSSRIHDSIRNGSRSRKLSPEPDPSRRRTTRSQEKPSRACAAIRQLHDRIKSDVPAGRNRNEADNFLKAAYGLARMMETPEISTFLKDLDKVETTSVASLLGFMFAFNLRFGIATTPSQRMRLRRAFHEASAVPRSALPQGRCPTGDRNAGPFTSGVGQSSSRAWISTRSRRRSRSRQAAQPLASDRTDFSTSMNRPVTGLFSLTA